LLLLWTSCRQPYESPFESGDKCRSDRCCPSLPDRYRHRLVGAFREAVPPRSSIVPTDNSRTVVRLRQSRRAARDGSRRAIGPLWLSLPCRLRVTPARRRTAPPDRLGGRYRHHIAPCHSRIWFPSNQGYPARPIAEELRDRHRGYVLSVHAERNHRNTSVKARSG